MQLASCLVIRYYLTQRPRLFIMDRDSEVSIHLRMCLLCAVSATFGYIVRPLGCPMKTTLVKQT